MNYSLENLNYYSDPRVCEPDSRPILYMDNGTEIELPTKWVVCDVCNGAGKHVNPAIDCGGLSDDLMDDPDFMDDYLSGAYDVTCNKCRGRTTIRGVDLDAMTKEQRDAYWQQLEDEAAERAEHLAEIRAGA